MTSTFWVKDFVTVHDFDGTLNVASHYPGFMSFDSLKMQRLSQVLVVSCMEMSAKTDDQLHRCYSPNWLYQGQIILSTGLHV